MSTLSLAEYIWLDGGRPTQSVRSKARVVAVPDSPEPADFPEWSFDGSSTEQAIGEDSDCLLSPVRVVEDPLRGSGNHLVLCEVLNPDGSPHESNQRATLRRVLDSAGPEVDPWVGFEQEYTIYHDGRPLGFPANGFPGPQGPYYCGIGADRAFGRDLVEAHAQACAESGIMFYGINAEVMPGQWEFQIGYRGLEQESADPLTVSDHVWLARWLLQRLGEESEIEVSFDPKPVQGDWNGAGAHTNFSIRSMREVRGGLKQIRKGIRRLGENHDLHIAHYGHGLRNRLTGLHETCSIDQFKDGVADRGASIRIPRQVEEKGCGYLEDRRPGANCDPYLVCRLILQTVCEEPSPSRLAAAS